MGSALIRSRPTQLLVLDRRSPVTHIPVRLSHQYNHAKKMIDCIHAAWMLDCDPRALQAIAEVESGPFGGFNEDRTPVILFERHVFERLTNHRYTGERVPGLYTDWAVISSSVPGGYGPNSVQHRRLAAAADLDRDAALRSASWGLFQILGENHAKAGYPKLQDFINAAYRSVDDHLRMLVMFMWNNQSLLQALRDKDWADVARMYNGPAYRKNQWDTKMAAAYERLA